MTFSSENPSPQLPIRELMIGETKMISQGRIIQLSHADHGISYFVDVTDREETDSAVSKDDQTKEIVREEMADQLVDQIYQDRFNTNSGIVVAVSRQFDQSSRTRIYIARENPNPHNPQSGATYVLSTLNFKSIGMHVPFSSDADDALAEIKAAVKELGNQCNFPDLKMWANMPSERSEERN